MSTTLPVRLDTIETAVASVAHLKGQFVRLVVERDCETLKRSNPPVIRKRTTSTVRVGVSYDNLKAVKEKREDGTLPAVNPGMSWGEWVVGLENYLKTHKGKYYLRVYPVNHPSFLPTVEFTANGEPVSKESIEQFLAASEKRNQSLDCYDVCLNNVESINSVEIPQD